MEDTLVVLPLPKIMNLIELLLGSLLKESEFAAEICGNQAAPSELLKLLNGVLDLLCVAVEVAGTALLMFTAQIRQWLELLTDRSPKTDGRHCVAVFKFIRRLERNSPAILLRQPLLSRLCQYALDAMHHDTFCKMVRHSGCLYLKREKQTFSEKMSFRRVWRVRYSSHLPVRLLRG